MLWTHCVKPQTEERGEGFGKKALSMADRAKQQCVPFRLSTVHESWLTLTKYEGAFFFSQSSGAAPVIAMNQTSARLRAGPRGAAADVDSGDTGAISQLPGDLHGAGGGFRPLTPTPRAPRSPAFLPFLLLSPAQVPKAAKGTRPGRPSTSPPRPRPPPSFLFPPPRGVPVLCLSVCPRHLGHRLPAPPASVQSSRPLPSRPPQRLRGASGDLAEASGRTP